jgi:subtilisin family serine protease
VGKFDLDNGAHVPTLTAQLSWLSFVEWAQPDYISKAVPDLTPSDPLFPQQWYHPQMSTPTAWDTTLGTSNITIAILDDGVHWRHEDLVENIWENTLEVNGTAGQDDDGNGFVDDFRGWDVIDIDNDPSPVPLIAPSTTNLNSHGTQVAGVAVAAINNQNAQNNFIEIAGTAGGRTDYAPPDRQSVSH